MRKLKKSFEFHILRWTGFLMISLTTLYDYYINRPKLSEQKNPFDYMVRLPSRGIGTTMIYVIKTAILKLE